MARKKTPRSSTSPTEAQATQRADSPARSHSGSRGLALGVVALAGACALGAWFMAGRTKPPAFARTPDQNVLLITIDTLRADALGSYGGRTRTPNLDRLAALGIRFEFAHAHAVVTLPSHASILTGHYPFEHGIHDNAGFRLRTRTPTLATLLHPLGLATGAFIGSFALDSRFGLNSGFDVYDERYGKSNVASGFKMAERRGDAVVAAATAWIAQQKGRWLAWVHVFDPHAPYEPPPPYDRQYADSPYLGEVAFTDAAVGPLLDSARDASGRPTLVIVTGDHGEGLGDHGEQTHGLFAYEATLRIPLILAQVSRDTPAWSAGSTAPPSQARVSTVAARHVDLVPTVLDALGLTRPAALPGRTLLPGPSGEDTAARPSYFEAMSTMFNRGWAPLTGVLVNRDKYIELPLPELYDLGVDPAEATNVADRQPDLRRTLESRLGAFGAPAPAVRQTEDPELRARLQALGYVTGHAPTRVRYTAEDDPKRLVEVDQQLRRAVELYERRDTAAAIAAFRRVIAERPRMELTYGQLAMLQWEAGQPVEAMDTLRAALKAGCDSVAIRTRLGTYLAESGNVKEAIPLLQQAADADTADADALNALGIALARSGRTAEARAAFERILAAEPANTMALENLGSIALGEGRLPDARKYFESALQADSGSTQANNGLGIVDLKSGNRKAALDRFSQSVSRDPGNYDALYNLATELANDGQLEAARPYLEQFARTAPAAFYARDIQRVRAVLRQLGR